MLEAVLHVHFRVLNIFSSRCPSVSFFLVHKRPKIYTNGSFTNKYFFPDNLVATSQNNTYKLGEKVYALFHS